MSRSIPTFDTRRNLGGRQTDQRGAPRLGATEGYTVTHVDLPRFRLRGSSMPVEWNRGSPFPPRPTARVGLGQTGGGSSQGRRTLLTNMPSGVVASRSRMRASGRVANRLTTTVTAAPKSRPAATSPG